jgi:phage/conjugal plasmid C-4 type zinc finger TraR family protein
LFNRLNNVWYDCEVNNHTNYFPKPTIWVLMMAGGWAPDGAVQDQIDASVEDAVKQVRNQLRKGVGLENCEDCDAAIPLARRQAIQGVRLCVTCQSEQDEQRNQRFSLNRRGSKDSQLR